MAEASRRHALICLNSRRLLQSPPGPARGCGVSIVTAAPNGSVLPLHSPCQPSGRRFLRGDLSRCQTFPRWIGHVGSVLAMIFCMAFLAGGVVVLLMPGFVLVVLENRCERSLTGTNRG
jgi:hypothetical protein